MKKSHNRKVNLTLLAACFLLLLFISGCKKNDSSPYYLNCKVNDTTVVLNYNIISGIDTSEIYFALDGFANASETSSTFLIEISGPNRNLSTGDYTDSSTNYSILASYYPNVEMTNNYYQSGSDLYINYGATGQIKNHFKLTITSITTDAIKGTFSGDFYLQGNMGLDKKTITNGAFYAKRK